MENAEAALARLEPVRQYDHAPTGEFWALYLRGQAYLRLKNTKAADEAFQAIVTTARRSPGVDVCAACRIWGWRARRHSPGMSRPRRTPISSSSASGRMPIGR